MMRKKVRKTSQYKWIIILFCFLLQFNLFTPPVRANTDYLIPADEIGANVLVVYTTNDGMVDEHLRQLDLLLGHFSTNISFVSDVDMKEKHLEGVTHLFYYGVSKQQLSPTVSRRIESFQGPLVAIGHNIEQFGNRFSFMELQDPIWVNRVSLQDQQEKQYLAQLLQINHVNLTNEHADVRLKAWKGERDYPLFIQNGNTFYYSSSTLFSRIETSVGEMLYHVFKSQSVESHPTYLRLEDVHPLSDPVLLREIADYLWEKQIPYSIAVIPVYMSENGKTTHLKDKQEMVATLKYMQEHGGSILLHGYAHKYRSGETGEGFEFWDVENNRPIYSSAEKDIAVKRRADFDSKQAYQDYIQELKTYEEQYIRERIEKGVRELVNVGLYPLAFEPPHYTMSQHGYKIVSEYFDGIFGQLQLSDDTWEIMGTSPYLTKPAMLHGMLLYPETVGYYDPNVLTPYQDIFEKLERFKQMPDGVIGFFYHPYLGLEPLKPIVEELEKIPEVDWIDLKEHNLTVTTPYLVITSGEGQGITVVDTLPDNQRLLERLSIGPFELVLWGVVFVVSLMVFLFIAYTISLRMRLRKSLFEEREVYNG